MPRPSRGKDSSHGARSRARRHEKSWWLGGWVVGWLGGLVVVFTGLTDGRSQPPNHPTTQSPHVNRQRVVFELQDGQGRGRGEDRADVPAGPAPIYPLGGLQIRVHRL